MDVVAFIALPAEILKVGFHEFGLNSETKNDPTTKRSPRKGI